MSSNTEYSKQDCIDSLQEAAEKLGHSPSQSEYKSLDILPSASYISRLYGWNNMKNEANLEKYSSQFEDEYSSDEVLSAIQRVNDSVSHSLTISDYKAADDVPCVEVVIKHFGSWNKAKEELNIKKHNVRHTCPEILDMSEEHWDNLNRSQRSNLRKRAEIIEYKLERGCQKCGYSEHPSALSFHHKNPENKKFNISSYAAHNMCSIWEEIEKCEVLCENCHQIVEEKWSWNC